MLPDQTADQILGLAAASKEANESPGCAVVDVKIWNADRVAVGKEALTCPSVPATDQTESSHLNPTGAGFSAVGVKLRGARVSGLPATISPSSLVGRYRIGPRC